MGEEGMKTVVIHCDNCTKVLNLPQVGIIFQVEEVHHRLFYIDWKGPPQTHFHFCDKKCLVEHYTKEEE